MRFRDHSLVFLMTYAAAVAQVSLRSELSIGESVPDLLILALTFVVFTFVGPSTIAWAASIGLIADCLSVGGIGVAMLSATVGAVSVQHWRSASVGESVFVDSGTMSAFIFLMLSATEWIRAVTVSGTLSVTGDVVPAVSNGFYTVLLGLAALLLGRLVLRFRQSSNTATCPSLSNTWKMLTP